MESVQDMMHSAVSRWRAWSPTQRTIFGIAIAVILTGTLTVGFQTGSTRYVPLSLGKQFSSDELTSIEQSLRKKNLTSYRREGNQLLVPEDEQTAYDAALLQERRLPQDWASEWEQKFEETNPFTSSRKLRMLKEIALAKELKRIIQGLDGIKEANVVWAESETHSWPARQQKVTASVNIRPEPGHELAEQTIRAIQFSVANMVPNLEPQDVIVLDCSVGRHYQLQPEQARFETDLGRWIDREVSRWQEQFTAAIAHHWPDAQVLVVPRQEALRQVAWQLLRNSSEDRESERTFHDVELELQHRFPEYVSLEVTLPAQDDSATEPRENSLEEEVSAVLIGWLPASFDAHQLRVSVESLPADRAVLDVAESEQATATWQPVIMIAAAGVLLLLVSRRFQTSAAVLETDPEPNADQTSTAGEKTVPRVSAQPMTPLGDPEQVADVLKQWLGSSQAADNAPPASDERD